MKLPQTLETGLDELDRCIRWERPGTRAKLIALLHEACRLQRDSDNAAYAEVHRRSSKGEGRIKLVGPLVVPGD